MVSETTKAVSTTSDEGTKSDSRIGGLNQGDMKGAVIDHSIGLKCQFHNKWACYKKEAKVAAGKSNQMLTKPLKT
eukprot:jgi/Psemu1/35283/gm1.35283_g